MHQNKKISILRMDSNRKDNILIIKSFVIALKDGTLTALLKDNSETNKKKNSNKKNKKRR